MLVFQFIIIRNFFRNCKFADTWSRAAFLCRILFIEAFWVSQKVRMSMMCPCQCQILYNKQFVLWKLFYFALWSQPQSRPILKLHKMMLNEFFLCFHSSRATLYSHHQGGLYSQQNPCCSNKKTPTTTISRSYRHELLHPYANKERTEPNVIMPVSNVEFFIKNSFNNTFLKKAYFVKYGNASVDYVKELPSCRQNLS